MAAGYDHVVECAQDLQTASQSEPDFARTTFSAEIEPGSPLRLVKFIAYGWSARRSMPALRDQVSAGLAEAKHTGWEDLVRLQREYLDEFWERADVEIDGEPRLQQALRFGMFHVVQSGARNEGRAIPAKGLTGSGYDGHAFWDTETFVLPMLTYALPSAARDALRWRHATLDKAQHRAAQLGLEGAAFPWRTIAGEECSSYWPAGTAAFHINADIAHAVSKYINATGDDDFIEDCGGELLVETARLWRSIGHHDSRGNFRIDGVTGPDEYSAVADNNVFTNLAARRNLLDAADNVGAPAGARPPPGRRCGGGGGVARRRQRDDDPLRRGARRAPPVRGLHRPRAVELRATPPTTPSRCSCTTRTSTSTASRWSSRPTWCSLSPCSATASPPRRRRATSPTTSR